MTFLNYKMIAFVGVIITFVASITTFYHLYYEKKAHDQVLHDSNVLVNRTYQRSLDEVIRYYEAKVDSYDDSAAVAKAFRERDHDAMERLMRSDWEMMQKENSSLVVLQFHNSDGTSLIRMHQPSVYGDSIAQKRPMIAAVHRTKNRQNGFEEGRQGVAYRIAIPYYYEGEYLGCIEFGINPAYFREKIRNYSGYESFVFIHRNAIAKFVQLKAQVGVGDFVGFDIAAKYLPLIHAYRNSNPTIQNSVVRWGHIPYEFSAIEMKDFRSRPIGAILFMRVTDDFESHVRHMVIMTVLIILVLIGVIGTVIGIIYRKFTQKMGFQQRYSQLILDTVPSPVIVTDGKHIIAANMAFLNYFDYETFEKFSKEHDCVCDYFEEGDTEGYLMPWMGELRWTEYMIQNPLKNHRVKITLQGEKTIFEVKLSLLEVSEERRYVVVFNDISTIQNQSMTDPLTKAANRLHFTMIFEHAIHIARRSEKPMGMIFYDIDHFKSVNDRFGHIVGDEVLKKVSEIVRNRIRKSDIFARWGGEEFVILLPDTGYEETIHLAEMLRRAVDEHVFDHVDHLTCSFGVAMLQEGDTPESLLKRSDEKLYQAKSTGRNKVVY